MAELDARAVADAGRARGGHAASPRPDRLRLDSTSAQAIAAGIGFVLLVVIALLVMTLLGHFI